MRTSVRTFAHGRTTEMAAAGIIIIGVLMLVVYLWATAQDWDEWRYSDHDARYHEEDS